MIKQTLFFCIIIAISACSVNHGRYQQKNDSKPTREPSGAELSNATPREEAHSRGGNKNYQIRGINYTVLSSAKSFKETGIASWYGQKFHGHLTSNGEIYDMYGMTAAHKNLPLPTYLKVTNTDNNKSVTVRVNDRGPFHPNRIIDLSYSAAYQLDMLETGTAKVEIRAITNFSQSIKKSNTLPSELNKQYIQVLATRNSDLAKNTANQLTEQYQQQVIWPDNKGVFRVQIGPIDNVKELAKILVSLRSSGYPKAYIRELLK
jgi:rare lipoprotein A|tara:strand:- start:2790 stop:3575 length:786 start_codon:yes stop_codon:yes gene_type:complete